VAEMRESVLRVWVVAFAVVACASVCTADTIWDYQQVNSVGYGIHPKVWADETDPSSRIIVEGVALAGVDEILDPSLQYTVFLQDDNSDRGGIQAWTGKFFYGEPMWSMLRATDYIDFQAGDRLRITGLVADMGRGKVVINNRGHSGAPNLVWHVDILGHPGLPDPELISSVSACNYFDQTRAGGGERYQTRYVMLHGAQISSGTWGNGNLMTIGDSTGSAGMLLSAMGDFNSYSQPVEKLNVVGIFDQEDDTVSPYTDGYRIWVKRMSDIAVALDACRQAASSNDNERVALVKKVVSRVYDGYFYVQDQERCGGIRVTSSRTVAPGDVISVQGIVTSPDKSVGPTSVGPTSEDIEKSISANYLSRFEQGDPPRPLVVDSRVLRGEVGLKVCGLLVRICGRIGPDQGNGTRSLTDGGGTVYVQMNGIAAPAEGTVVAVTGVAASSGQAALILLAGEDDISQVDQSSDFESTAR